MYWKTNGLVAGMSAMMVVFCLASSSLAQPGPADLRLTVEGSTGFRVGEVVAGVGDVDGDGIPDVAAGDFMADFFGPSSGSVRVFSGRNGSLLQLVNGPFILGGFGFAIAGMGDVNGDGFSDYAVGAPTASSGSSQDGAVFVISGGPIPSVLQTQLGVGTSTQLGRSLSAIADVTGDGISDLAIGAPGHQVTSPFPAGAVVVVSGSDGTLVHLILGSQPGDGLGWVVSAAGDVDGDGVHDIVAGTQANHALVLSGATGAIIHTLTGPISFGFSVAGVGDTNGDGRSDVLVGAPFAAPAGISGAPGQAFLFSGLDGSILHTFTGTSAVPLSRFGDSVSWAADANGDGISDYAVGAPFDGIPGILTGAVYVYSGGDGSLLRKITGSIAGQELGESVSALGDVNGDGFADLVVGSPGAPTFNGSVSIMSAVAVDRYTSQVFPLATLDLSWAPGPAGSTHAGSIMAFTSLAANAAGAIGLSFAPLDINLTPIALGALLIDLSPGTGFLSTFTFLPDGTATFPLDVRVPALAGTVLYTQAAFATVVPSMRMSNGVQILMGR